MDPSVDKPTVKAIIEMLGRMRVMHRVVDDCGGWHCVFLAKLDLASPQTPFPRKFWVRSDRKRKSHETLEVE